MRQSWLFIFVALLAACGLEPVYVTPSPAIQDGTFTWVDVGAAPPDGYTLVIFTPPDGAAPLTLCRAEVVDPGLERGPHPGFVVGEPAAGSLRCWVAHRGQTLRFGAYQQLWAAAGASYRWEHYAGDEGFLQTSRYYRSNRVALEPMVSIPSGQTLTVWHPCADRLAGRWYLGKTSMGDGTNYGCEIPTGEAADRTRSTAALLYAPVEE